MARAYFRYIVNDVDAAIRFYRDHLGFSVTQHPAPGFAALDRGEVRLLLNAPGSGGAGAELSTGEKPQPGGWNRLQIRVDDLQSQHEVLLRSGLRFRGEIIHGRGGDQALLEDPSGNLVELFEPGEQQAESQARPALAPFIAVDDIEPLITFLQSAFDAHAASRMRSDDGVTRHATVRLGEATLMLSIGTDLYGQRPMTTHLYVNDVDATYARAIAAGGKSLQAPNDEFYGDRRAGIVDRWGNHWWIATQLEDLDPPTIKVREAEFRAASH